MERICFPVQDHQQDDRAERVGHQCRNGYTLDCHVKDNHQEQVEGDVQKAGQDEHDEGASGIALASQHCRFKVVEHDKGHTQEIDPEIQDGLCPKRRPGLTGSDRRMRPGADEYSYNCQNDADQQGQCQ